MTVQIQPRWMRIAWSEAESGVHELDGPDENFRILQYHQTTTLKATRDEVPWCASAVCWCLQQSGFPHTASAAARSYLQWGRRIHPWAYGAVVVLMSTDDAPGPEVLDAPGHVGFLIDAPTPSEVLVLGGNQSDAFNVRPYRRERVLDVRWAA